MPAWTRKHLLGLEDLTRDEVVSILDRAETYLETARNPAASGKIFTPMIVGLALIESLVIYSLIISFSLLGKIH